MVGSIVGLVSMCCIGMEPESDLLKPINVFFDEDTEINCALSNKIECYWIELPGGKILEVKENFETNTIEGILTRASGFSGPIKFPEEVYNYLRDEYARRTCKVAFPSSLCPKLVSFLRNNLASEIINKVYLS